MKKEYDFTHAELGILYPSRGVSWLFVLAVALDRSEIGVPELPSQSPPYTTHPCSGAPFMRMFFCPRMKKAMNPSTTKI